MMPISGKQQRTAPTEQRPPNKPPSEKPRTEQFTAQARIAKAAITGARGKAVDNFIMAVQTGLAMLGTRKIEFALDARIVEVTKEDLKEAVLEIADEIEPFGTFLDKAAKIGPFGKLAQVLIPVGAQIATNHNILPEQLQEALGTIPKQALIDELKRRNAKEQEAAQEMANGANPNGAHNRRSTTAR